MLSSNTLWWRKLPQLEPSTPFRSVGNRWSMPSTVARIIATLSMLSLPSRHSFQLAAGELSLASSSITTTKKLLIL
eukprot:335124-Rhodomonas_salina.1